MHDLKAQIKIKTEKFEKESGYLVQVAWECIWYKTGELTLKITLSEELRK